MADDHSAPEALKLTPALRSLLERIDRQSGTLMLLQVIASGGRANSQLNALRRAGYVVKADHPTVINRGDNLPEEALAITPEGKAALERTRR